MGSKWFEVGSKWVQSGFRVGSYMRLRPRHIRSGSGTAGHYSVTRRWCGLIHMSARWYDRSYDRPTVAQSLAGRRLSDNGIVSGGGGSGRRVVVDHGGVGARDRPAPSSASSAYLSPAT